MRIITQAIRVIDYENNKISARNIMPKFGEYIEQLISYINGNVSVREYKTQSTGTEVISSILEIIKHQAEAEIVLQRIDCNSRTPAPKGKTGTRADCKYAY